MSGTDTTAAAPEPPKISLIVCTRNRAAKLRACLDRIARLRASIPWELFLVDNRSTDDTAKVIHEFIATVPFPSYYLFVERPGNGAGRNAAIELSRGEIVAFTDDDCYVDEMFLERVYEVFEDPTVGYMSGRILLFDKTDYPVTINESTQPLPISAYHLAAPGLIQGANVAFRRAALDAAGLFDPNFGAGTRFSGEECELAMRVSRQGWRGGYFPAPIVWHHHGRKSADSKGLMKFYGVGEGALYAKGLLDKSLRRDIALVWARSIARDLFRHGTVGHLWHVLCGAVQYWYLRATGQLVSV